MLRRFLASISAMVVLTAASVAAQDRPRTPDGQPDLQGIWTNITITPMERPARLADREFLTEQEADDYEKQFIQLRDATSRVDSGGPLRQAWWDSGTTVVKTRRTSIVIDPRDGKIPALTPEAQKREQGRRETMRRPPRGPEDRPLYERCILWPTDGPPMVSSNYNNNYRIVQTPGLVAIYIEMIHDVRLIPLEGRPQLPSNIRNWMGDSRGHWEGETLVVDSANFTDKTNFYGSDRNLHVIERFTRTAPDTLLYQFTIDDPTAFTGKWTGEVPWSTAPGPILEYACHEGNDQSMSTMLRNARAEEETAKKLLR